MTTSTTPDANRPPIKMAALCRRLAISEDTARRWDARGILPRSYRVAGQRHWRPEDIDRWEADLRETKGVTKAEPLDTLARELGEAVVTATLEALGEKPIESVKVADVAREMEGRLEAAARQLAVAATAAGRTEELPGAIGAMHRAITERLVKRRGGVQ